MDTLLNPEFRLDGEKYSKTSLSIHAQSLAHSSQDFKKNLGIFILEWLNDKSYVLAQTSGSTGTPKEVKILKSHMVNSAIATSNFFNLKQGTRALLCLPVQYIAGKMMIVRAMVLGWQIDTIKPSTNPLEGISKTYNFCAMTPLQLGNSLSKLNLLEKLIVGGGAIPAPVVSKIQNIATNIYETYGMTETVTHIAARHVNAIDNKKSQVPFKTLPQVTIDVDTRGCLTIKAPSVNSKVVITNDIVKIISEKEFYLLGRIDNVINSGGVKLFPEQIEHKLNEYIPVPFFVFGLPDQQLGERLVLFIEQVKPFILKKDILDDNLFLPFEIPKKVITIPSFKRTLSGKIQRKQTVESYLKI